MAGPGEEQEQPGLEIRAVLDTNSLVPGRLRRDLQQNAQLGLYTAIWSPWIIAELNRVLTWRWIEYHGGDWSAAAWQQCSQSAKAMMVQLIASLSVVAPVPPYPHSWEALRDQWDQPIWAAAKLSGAQYVVSENRRDYPPVGPDGRHLHKGIEYLPASVFLGRLLDT